jgi:demethylmenaquinone methyltransferase / 2-methoxy-6-polyprenyl-1,4-benzoquinol methylase
MNRASSGRRPHDSLIPADENRQMFDHIAGYYDGTNRLLSLGFDASWRRSAVAALSPSPGSRYLDVGCGTGDIAVEILRQQNDCNVTGIDPSAGMLEIGTSKIESLGLDDRIFLQEGDALHLDFPDDTFDGSITSFCIRNVTDRKGALKEICRVVKPGGALVILELTEPQGFIMKPLFRIYSKVVMPVVTGIMSSASAYRYLADSMADFPKPQTILALMESVGFVNVTHRHMTGGIVTVFVGKVATD